MIVLFLCLLFWTCQQSLAVIDHSILLHRLHHDFRIQGSALDWFSSYLTNCTQSVSIHCYTSEPAPISLSVPQGSVLGPVLFVLYAAPLSTVIEKHSILHNSYAVGSQLQKSVVFNLLCVLDLFSERWQSTLFQVFQKSVPLIKSLTSSSLCRNVLMTLNPGWH